eukprot:TRINITY_DN40748_c0_g1_i1.p1 TRINITY_DN40748_c0_g1~~TRINITY_DN40748_c0_g1_i1.p1  ORF type:complete len:179 (+),score=21.79 TRINITY_DN40748_c0_g1_i1:73-537(+)
MLHRLCSNAEGYITHLNNATDIDTQAYSQYFITFKNHLLQFIETRQTVFLPYIDELFNKSATGHNCSTCSGRCEVQHGIKLLELNTTLEQLRSIAADLKTTLPSLANTAYKGELKILHNEVELLHNVINELLYLESEVLIPKIKEAQNSINAYN